MGKGGTVMRDSHLFSWRFLGGKTPIFCRHKSSMKYRYTLRMPLDGFVQQTVIAPSFDAATRWLLDPNNKWEWSFVYTQDDDTWADWTNSEEFVRTLVVDEDVFGDPILIREDGTSVTLDDPDNDEVSLIYQSGDDLDLIVGGLEGQLARLKKRELRLRKKLEAALRKRDAGE